VVQWPEGLEPGGAAWRTIADAVARAELDLLVTNELPFGPWIADGDTFDRCAADACVLAHDQGLAALRGLAAPAILSSRPIWTGMGLANEAVVLEDGATHAVHHKTYLPAEPGWREASWFTPGRNGFKAMDVGGLRVGALLCTDAMYTEHARSYGRQGAQLIAIPRASGACSEIWLAAGKMAAIVSGCYVVSSNRTGCSRRGARFGGAGFAYDPTGALIGVTTDAAPLLAVDIDPGVALRQREAYPCYLEG
jgi:N-carbamoylputrescine amidase